MQLVTPAIGLVFWMLVTFSILILILKKFAWGPILGSIKDREDSINNSLSLAEQARNEMAKLQGENENLLAQARQERESMLKEAREMKERILNEAKTSAETEAKSILNRASEEINKQKFAAMDELKKEIASYSVQIAEKLLQESLANNDAQQKLIDQHLNELTRKN